MKIIGEATCDYSIRFPLHAEIVCLFFAILKEYNKFKEVRDDWI